MKYLKTQKKFRKTGLKKKFFNKVHFHNESPEHSNTNAKPEENDSAERALYRDYVDCYYSATRWK